MKLHFDTSDLVHDHCAEGRCNHPFYNNCLRCRNFRKLVMEGKNPTMCQYYNHTLDYNNKRG